MQSAGLRQAQKKASDARIESTLWSVGMIQFDGQRSRGSILEIWG